MKMDIHLVSIFLSSILMGVLGGPDFPRYKQKNRECYKCPPGYCVAADSDRSLNCPYSDDVITFPSCIECSVGYYSSGWTSRQYCLQKDLCNKENEIVYRDGGRTNNTICACSTGYQYSEHNKVCEPISKTVVVPLHCPPCPDTSTITTTSVTPSCNNCPVSPVIQSSAMPVITCDRTNTDSTYLILFIISLAINILAMVAIIYLLCCHGIRKNIQKAEINDAKTDLENGSMNEELEKKVLLKKHDRGSEHPKNARHQGTIDENNHVDGIELQGETLTHPPYSDVAISVADNHLDKSTKSETLVHLNTTPSDDKTVTKKSDLETKYDIMHYSGPKTMKENIDREQLEKDREQLEKVCKYLEPKILYDDLKKFFRELGLNTNEIDDIIRIEGGTSENMCLSAFVKWQKRGSTVANIENLKNALKAIQAITTLEELILKFRI